MCKKTKRLCREILVLPHAHQANILKCPQNENFIILQLFMRIQLIFFVLGNYQFLKLIVAMQYLYGK
ncbi:hypothetical protein BW425_26995 [Bacillus pseudomycoides]|uniref:Uncharacterized protein n=1 Tax=Bacillus pseudomycoides TaxID=64104 RepID=A0A1Y3MAH9_9BACI|nr:hypothetical protein BW425_26995 [Bacillus pseudomycoides]